MNQDMPEKKPKTQKEYLTWEAFKRDLESRVRSPLPIGIWLRARPKTPLPWHGGELQASLKELLRIQKSQRNKRDSSHS